MTFLKSFTSKSKLKTALFRLLNSDEYRSLKGLPHLSDHNKERQHMLTFNLNTSSVSEAEFLIRHSVISDSLSV